MSISIEIKKAYQTLMESTHLNREVCEQRKNIIDASKYLGQHIHDLSPGNIKVLSKPLQLMVLKYSFSSKELSLKKTDGYVSPELMLMLAKEIKTPTRELAGKYLSLESGKLVVKHAESITNTMLIDLLNNGLSEEERASVKSMQIPLANKLESLECVGLLPNLQKLKVTQAWSLSSFNELASADKLEALHVEQAYELASLEGLKGLNLISLGIPSASSVQTLEPLAGKALTHLNISGCKGILDFSAVTSLSSLSKLEVKDVALWNAFASSIDLSDTLDVEV